MHIIPCDHHLGIIMLDVNRFFEFNVQGFLKIFTKITLYGFIINLLM